MYGNARRVTRVSVKGTIMSKTPALHGESDARFSRGCRVFAAPVPHVSRQVEEVP